METRNRSARASTGGVRTAVAGWLTPARFALLLAFIVILAFGDVLFGGRSFFYRDFGLWAYPNAFYHRDRFWAGEVPLWNALSQCGLPFLAQWNTLTLYPVSLLYLLLPLPWSLNVFCLAHLWWAGLGMYLLALRWTRSPVAASVGGLAYALNGLTLHSLMWPNNLAALGWAPWVILCAEKAWRRGGRCLPLAAAVSAMQVLTGAPEMVLFTGLLLLVLLVADLARARAERWALLGRSLAVGLAALGLSSIQLLPFAHLVSLSQRSAAFADGTWSVPLWGFANLLVPLFHETRSVVGVYSQDAQQWTSSYYLGVGPMALALLALVGSKARRAWPLAGLAWVGWVMALGESTPVFGWVKSVFPLLGMVRFPVKFVVLLALTVPLLAALGTSRALDRGEGKGDPFRGLLAVGVLLFVASGIIAGWAWSLPFPGEDRHLTLASAATRMMFLLLILLWLRLLRASGSATGQGVLQLLLAGTLALDALTHAPRQNPTIAAAALRPGLGMADGLPAVHSGRVMITPEVQGFMERAATSNHLQYFLGQRRTLFANCNLIDGVPKVDGMFSLHLKASAQVHALLSDASRPSPGGLVDFLGVRAVPSPSTRFGWQQRPGGLPLVTAGQRIEVAPPETSLPALIERGFDGREVVFLEPADGGVDSPPGRVPVETIVREMSNHRIVVEARAPRPSVVVVAQAYHPCWRAAVNGRDCPLQRANHAFQAVRISAGVSRVVLRYEDRALQAGWLLTILSTALCLGGIVRGGLPARL